MPKLKDKSFTLEDKVKSDKQKIQAILAKKPIYKSKTENQAKLTKSIKEKDITICSAMAGTGKTFVSTCQALDLLFSDDNEFTKIILIKSVSTIRGEELGFLKGTLQEKLEPILWSFMLNITKIYDDSVINSLIEKGFILPIPASYLRGVNFDNCIVLVDEAQNFNKDALRTILTRLSYTSKMIILGDERQVDLKNKSESSLSFMIDKLIENPIEEIGVVRMFAEDLVRNPLIEKIEKIFE